MIRSSRGLSSRIRSQLGQIRSQWNYVSKIDSSDDPDEIDPPLVRFRDAPLTFPGSNSPPVPVTLTIHSADQHGGHALLGRNGSGKTLIAQSLIRENMDGIHIPRRSIQHVSMQSHQELLQAGGTVYKALSQGNLNKAAQFLVVRFGLFPLLHQDVRTLSNGQIKKVLIVRALSMRPKLLVLDNAFDGLDVPSRDVLKDLVAKTLQGFARDKLLVQAVSVKNTAKTQVLLLTHRAEEIVNEVDTLSYFEDESQSLRTIPRENLSSQALLELALGKDDVVTLPSRTMIQEWWGREPDISSLVVNMEQLSVTRNDKTLLHDLTWQVRQGQSWLVGGANGAGKSTLSRLMARKEDEGGLSGTLQVNGTVGWVATEHHMALVANSSDLTVRELIANGSDEDISNVADWLAVKHLLDQRFGGISQGEQRLVLIAAAIACRPNVLVLDEPCQGLDLIHREHVLELIELICTSTDMSLIYITHHLEEKVDSISHVLHLAEGDAVFEGLVEDYKPEEL